MTAELLNKLKEVSLQLGEQGKILEVGSRDINGSPREVFSAKEYIGTDIKGGPKVDLVIPGKDLLKRFQPESFDLVVSTETLEHDVSFWKTVSNMRKLVKKGGWLVISTPSPSMPAHGHNYEAQSLWRFDPDSYSKVFFKGFVSFKLYEVNYKYYPEPSLLGVGRRPGRVE